MSYQSTAAVFNFLLLQGYDGMEIGEETSQYGEAHALVSNYIWILGGLRMLSWLLSEKYSQYRF